jgi:hypothetical protein
VVLNKFSLDGADVAGGGRQEFAEQQRGREQGGRDEGRLEFAGFERIEQLVDHATGKQDGEQGDKALGEEKCCPGEGPAAGSLADEREGSGKMTELPKQPVQPFGE